MDKDTKDALKDGIAGPFGCAGLLASFLAMIAGFIGGLSLASLFDISSDATFALVMLCVIGAPLLFWRAVIRWK